MNQIVLPRVKMGTVYDFTPLKCFCSSDCSKAVISGTLMLFPSEEYKVEQYNVISCFRAFHFVLLQAFSPVSLFSVISFPVHFFALCMCLYCSDSDSIKHVNEAFT